MEIIGRIGNFSMPSRSESLWILAIEFSCGRAGRIYSFVLVNWSFDLILRKAFCTFLSIVFVWSWFSFWNCSVSSSSRHFPWLRYFNFEPSFKLRWRHARDLFGSQIPVSTWGFERLGNYFVCKGFAVQTLLRSLEFMIQINLERDTIDNFSWSLSLFMMTTPLPLSASEQQCPLVSLAHLWFFYICKALLFLCTFSHIFRNLVFISCNSISVILPMSFNKPW